MKKIYTLAIALCCTMLNLQATTVLYDYDFDSNNVEGIAFYDLDRLTPSKFMSSLQFAVDKPWISLKDSYESTNTFYGSTSQYTPAGQANDWMVMPAAYITSEGFVLRWQSQSFMSDLRDGLKVFISTESQDPATFPDAPVWEVAEEDAGATENFDGEFVDHELSLDAYVGQTIYVAFVNQSYDKSIIAVDEISVIREDYFSVTLANGSRVEGADSFTPAGYILNERMELINEVTISIAYDDATVSETYTGLNLAKGERYDFTMQEAIPLKLNETLNYVLTATADGARDFVINGSMTSSFTRRVVIEDHTGLWCGACPVGIWAIDSLKETYPNNIVPIAVQNGSGLVVDTYDNGMYAAVGSSFPYGWVDRTYASHPMGSNDAATNLDADDSWIGLFKKRMELVPEAGVEVEYAFNDDQKTLEAKASVTSVAELSEIDWRVIFVLTEDSVTGYSQKNYYAGMKTWYGGWQSLPGSVAKPMYDVARGIYPSFRGASGSLPATIAAGETVAYSYQIEIPESVQRWENLNLIAMVVDGSTAQVVNADITRLNVPMAVDKVGSDKLEVRTTVDNDLVTVTAPSQETLHIALYTADGKQIANVTARGTATLSAAGYKGVALLRVIGAESSTTTKVVVR